jgi:uncharacterized membrane protein
MNGKGLSRKQQRALNRQQSKNPAGSVDPGGVAAFGLSYRSGPLPSAKELAEYDAVVPGMAKTLVDNLTSQTEHRIEIETIVVKGNDKRATRGQWMAFILALVVFAIGGYLLANDKKTEGLVAIIGSISGMVVVFVTGKIFQARERKDKRQGQ